MRTALRVSFCWVCGLPRCAGGSPQLESLPLPPPQIVRASRLEGQDNPLEVVYFVEGPGGERVPAATSCSLLNRLDVQRAAIVLGYRVQAPLARREFGGGPLPWRCFWFFSTEVLCFTLHFHLFIFTCTFIFYLNTYFW